MMKAPIEHRCLSRKLHMLDLRLLEEEDGGEGSPNSKLLSPTPTPPKILNSIPNPKSETQRLL